MIERLKEIRSESGLSQELFGQKMGVSRRTQNAYEAGVNRPSTDYLQKIAEAGFDVNYLLTGERRGETLSAEDSELLALWHRAPEAVRLGMVSMLKTNWTAEKEQTVRKEKKVSGNVLTHGLKDLGGAMKRTITRFDDFQAQRRAKFSPLQLAIAETIDRNQAKIITLVSSLTMLIYFIYIYTGKITFGDDSAAYHVIIPWECYISIVVFVAIFEKCNGYPLWNGVKKWWRGE